MTLEIELDDSSTTKTIGPEDIISVNPVKTHTGVGDWRARVRGDRGVDSFARKQARATISDGSTVLFTGYLLGSRHDKTRGTTELRGRGIAKRLQETSPGSGYTEVKYSNIALQDAIRDYWGKTPFSASVTDQNTSVVDSGVTLANPSTTTEFESLFSPAADKPIRINNGTVEQLQSCFVEDIGGSATSVNYSGGDARAFAAPGDNESFNITVNYESNFTVATRTEVTNENDYNEYNVYVDGTQIGPDNPATSLGWADLASTTLSAGTHTIEVELNDISGFEPDESSLDLIAVYDNSYSFNFDNSVHQDNGYLDGPELYAPVVELVSDFQEASLNIAEATVSAQYNDTTGDQALALNFDSANSFDEGKNTSSHTATNPGASRQVRTRLSFSRYPPPGTNAQSATPRFGYNGQEVSSLTLTANLDDLQVIDELTLSKNHFDNLKTLHENGTFLWTIEHDDSSIGNLTVESYPREAVSQSLPPQADNEVNQEPEVDTETYYNAIDLEGRLSNGSRPQASEEDSTRVSNDGRRISPGVLRDPDISTDAGARFRARNLLDRAKQKDAVRGTVTIPAAADDIQPGYTVSIDFGNGTKQFVVEEVRYQRDGDSAEAVVDVVRRQGLDADIEELRRQAKKQSDQI